MWTKDFLSCAWWILVIALSGVSSSGWKPIAPPAEYYATRPTTCVSDCDLQYKNSPGDNMGEAQAESQLKSTLLSQPTAFNQGKEFHQSNKKLDLVVFKPTEVSFFPQEHSSTYQTALPISQEVLRKTPTSFFSLKNFRVPHKQTIYYGDVELAKPKLTNDVKYYKPYKPSDVKIFNPATFKDNEIGSHRPSIGGNIQDEHCSLYKVSFRQDLYYQYIQYKVHMPELKEFTLCLWSRFHNHSHDHSLFSYSTKRHVKAIYMWASNLNEPGFFNMKIMDQTIFRLNYPIKLYKWYHTCQSWNGNTGEWQVWVDSYRIARGFHNLLVGHPIPGGGTAISGQDQRHFGKGFQEVSPYFKGSGGLEGEITMLQMYKVALTAGKAYNDHSHHHSHYQSTTEEPPDIPEDEPTTTTDHPFLENGQLKTHVNVLEVAEALKKGKIEIKDHKPEYEVYQHHVPHAYIGQIAPLAVHGNAINFIGVPHHAIFKRNDESKADEIQTETNATTLKEVEENREKIKYLTNISGQVQIEKVKFSNRSEENENDTDANVQFRQKIEQKEDGSNSSEVVENLTAIYEDKDEEEDGTSGFRVGKRLKRHNFRGDIRIVSSQPIKILPGKMKPAKYSSYRLRSRGDKSKIIFTKNGNEASKRHFFYEDPHVSFGSGNIMNHELQSPFLGIQSNGLSYGHFPFFGQDNSELSDGDDTSNDDDIFKEPKVPKPRETELAEGEVRRIMYLCSGCHLDPFRKVAVISWRSTPKKIYSGALFIKAKSECENF